MQGRHAFRRGSPYSLATPIETESAAIGVRRLVSDLFRALAFAIGNENLQ
jgi:hypothetical protein